MESGQPEVKTSGSGERTTREMSIWEGARESESMNEFSERKGEEKRRVKN